jgi:hypothetical protein
VDVIFAGESLVCNAAGPKDCGDRHCRRHGTAKSAEPRRQAFRARNHNLAPFIRYAHIRLLFVSQIFNTIFVKRIFDKYLFNE